MADLKTTNIYGDAYINNKVGIATNAPATRLQIGQLLPTAATEGIQFGDDTSARIYRDSSTLIKVSGGFTSTTFINAGNYLQTSGNLIYPASQTATQRLEVGNASGNAWIDGLTIAQGGNVTVYNNLTTPTATVSGTVIFPNTSNAGLTTTDGTALFRLDDIYGNIYLLNNAGGFYVDATSHNFRNASSVVGMTISNVGDVTATRYLSGTYVTTSDDTSSTTVSYIMAKFGDNFHRSAPAAKVATFLSGQTMNIVGTSTNITAYTINQNVGTANSPTFAAITGTQALTVGNSLTRPASLATLNNYAARIGGTDVYLNIASLDGTYNYPVAIQSGRNSDNVNFPLLLNPNGGNITVGQYTGLGYTFGVAGTGYFSSTLQATRLNFSATGATPYTSAAGEGFGNGITFGGDDNSAYYRIFTGMENVGGNYSKLTLNWHTGIRIGAYINYGGVRFYNNSVGQGGSEIFSVGNLDSNVRVVNSLIVNGITINQERATNARMYGAGTGAFGLLGLDSAGSFRWQLYGEGSNYGFLNGAWAGWDIKKTVSGALYLNSNDTYYLNPASTTNLLSLTVANTITGAVSGNAGTVTNGIYTTSVIYIGTTAITMSRSSAAQTLTGISIDGNAANITAYTINQNVGTANSPTFVGLSLTSVSTTGATITNLTGAYQNTTVYDSAKTQSATPSRGIRAPASSIQFTDGYAIAPFYTYRSTGDWPVPYGIGWGTGGESSGIFQRYASNGSSFGDMIFYTGNDGFGAFSFRRHTWEGTAHFAAGSGELNTELFRVDWSGNVSMLGTLNGSANSATLYPNNGPYGSWKIGGTRGGWYGIEFESGTILMANSSESGFYRNGVGWQMWWSGGTGYVQKGGSGGGTQATILESSNYTSYTPGLGTNNTLTGINTINNTSNTVINTLSGNLGLTMYQATAGTDAYMTFHIGGDYAAYFGLGGAENDLVYGGWSAGNNRHRILHSGNATYAWNMNQFVRTTDTCSFAGLTVSNTITGAVSGNAGTVTNGLYTTGGQTIAGITYFSNGESMNVYGIRGRFTNEYLHLYNKVGIGSPNGWGQGETSTPIYGLSTYGGLNIAYGDNGISTFNGVIRANSNIRQGADLAMPLSSWSVSGTSTGMVIFSFPGNTGNYGMVHCVFDIYEYNSNTVSTVIVGGHNWNGAWYNTGANVIGRCGKSVRLGVKDSRYCVVFGGAASSWDYGTIILRKIHNGGFYTGIMDMGGSFTTQQTATESFSNISGDLRLLRTSADFIADGGISGTTGTFSGELNIAGNYQIRNANPTITFRDTNNRTGYIHVNGDIFYILTGVADSGYGNWTQVANSRWPLELNLSNNNAAFGGVVDAISFTGAGTGLTGTAASLNIGGNAGTATILQTARTINGTSFNGSAAITTANWGTARTLTIGSTGKSVDGSVAITWSLAEIGAAATNQTMFVGTTSVAINRASAAQTLTGVSIDGNAGTVTNGIYTTSYYTGTPLGKRRYRIHSADSTSLNSSITNLECGFTYGGSGEPTGPFIAFGGLGGSIDYSCQLAGAYSGGGNDFKIRTRNDDSSIWNTWRTLVTDGNYTSYSPTLTGTGASGTWSINVTGNAGGSSTSCSGNAATATALTSMNISQFTNNSGYLTSVTNISGNAATATTATNVGVGSGNTSAAWYPVVWHSGNTLFSSAGVQIYAGNNYVQATYFNSSDNDETGITRFVIKNGDGYHRSATTTSAADIIRGVASGTWSITAATANALNTGNTYQVANIGIGVSPSNRLHINGDGVNPTIRIDNTVFGTGSSNSRVFFGWLPISINVYGTVTTKYIQLYNSF